ncbi:MAG: hypothetical protein CXB60_02235 [Spiroplasma poulsonii]|nr:hypothetical protein [Spiroplasma poulsonii]
MKKSYFTLIIKPNLKDIIKNFNLNLINNSNEAILNELNYLNPTLDISQLETVNKKRTSVTIKAKNMSDKYFGEKKIYFKYVILFYMI